LVHIDYFDIFTIRKQLIQVMPKGKSFLLLLLFVSSLVLCSACSSRKSLCTGNVTHKTTSYNKRNKNNYGKRYSYKSKSVRKDYVIKNGIAH
jgi:hypothetical protein